MSFQQMIQEQLDIHLQKKNKQKKPLPKLPTSAGSLKKQEFQKNIYYCLLTMPKPLTVWITINSGKF